MKLKMELINGEVVVRKFAIFPKEAETDIKTVLNSYIQILRNKIVGEKLSGQVLRVRTGMLRSSFLPMLAQRIGNTIIAGLTSNIHYWRIHEFGGKTRPHTIFPRNKKALHFFVKGNEVFATKVDHPGSLIPARPYVRPSIIETWNKFQELIGNALTKAWKK